MGTREALAIIHRSRDLRLTCGTVHCGGNVGTMVEERDNRNSKGDKVPLVDNRGATCGKIYLRSLIQLGLMYPPFWFSTLKSKKAMLILLEGNIEDHYLRRSCHIFQAVTHDFHTGFHNL